MATRRTRLGRRTLTQMLTVPGLALALLFGSPMTGTALAGSITFSGNGSTGDSCNGGYLNLSGPIVASVTKQGNEVLVKLRWSGTAGSDTFVISGQADLTPSTTSYSLPVQGTFKGPDGNFSTVGATGTVYLNGSGDPVGASFTWPNTHCDT